MLLTPEGIAVHQDEGCEGELFRGPMGCYHSKEHTHMTSMTTADGSGLALTPAPLAFSDAEMQVIKDTICRGATDAELQLFIATCTRTGLDPFVRQIYAVKRWDAGLKREVMAIQVGIDGQRLTAERTHKYAGQDPIEWLDENGVWSEVWTGAGKYPVAARCSVYRTDWGDRKATAVARWQSYAQSYKKDGAVYYMPTWEAMPDVMLGKCAESLALRRAFPAEMSALYSLVGGGYDPGLDVTAEAEPAAHHEPTGNVIDGEIVAPTEPEQEQEPKPEPIRRKPTGEMTVFWQAARQEGLAPDYVLSKSQEWFGNREPVALSPQERTDLMTRLLQEAPVANPGLGLK